MKDNLLLRTLIRSTIRAAFKDPEVLEKLVMSLGYHSAIASANERMENIEMDRIIREGKALGTYQ